MLTLYRLTFLLKVLPVKLASLLPVHHLACCIPVRDRSLMLVSVDDVANAVVTVSNEGMEFYVDGWSDV